MDMYAPTMMASKISSWVAPAARASLICTSTQYSPPAAVAADIKAMEDEKIICGYHTLIDWDKVADEMVNLIVAQRAYELNSKAITTADSMLETANNLRR